jgi:hypothetical protein
MRRQTVYEETNGEVPVAHGFGTAVLRRLSVDLLMNGISRVKVSILQVI